MTSTELFELAGKQFKQFNLPELFCQHPYVVGQRKGRP